MTTINQTAIRNKWALMTWYKFVNKNNA